MTKFWDSLGEVLALAVFCIIVAGLVNINGLINNWHLLVNCQ